MKKKNIIKWARGLKILFLNTVRMRCNFAKPHVFFLALLFALSVQSAHASKLPDNLWTYVKNELPNATQRFDSVIALPNNVLYIPLYPSQKNDVEKIEIEYTFPKTGTLSALPEVVIFNNNFVLLKVFKDKKGNSSITLNENLPIKVRLGIMPQDMLVPVGLQIPESLKLVLGNLEVPQIIDDTIVPDSNDKSSRKQLKSEFNAALSGSVTNTKQAFVPLNEFKSKKFFVASNSSKFIYVYDGTTKDPLYELKLSSLPSKILASNNSKFALVIYYANKTIDIVDLQAERVLEKITLSGVPKDAEIDSATDLAYITSAESGTIYVVDLKSGRLSKEIKLEQSPNKIAVSQNGGSLAFIDHKTSELYCLSLNSDYISKFIAKTNNISKVLIDDSNIYTVSRTGNKLNVYDAESGAMLDEQAISEKPVDAIKYNNKIYILCAKEGTLDIYDCLTKKIIKVVSLDKSGFYSKITQIPNQANAIITGVGANKFLLFDLEDFTVKRKQPFEVDVSNLIMIDK